GNLDDSSGSCGTVVGRLSVLPQYKPPAAGRPRRRVEPQRTLKSSLRDTGESHAVTQVMGGRGNAPTPASHPSATSLRVPPCPLWFPDPLRSPSSAARRCPVAAAASTRRA